MMNKQKVIELWGDAPKYIIVACESWDALEGDTEETNSFWRKYMITAYQ